MSSYRGVENDTPPVAVIDIGSNSIRLVVYEAMWRAPLPVFNEKVLCGLGRGLDESGRLSAAGVELALQNLPRFVGVARSMGAEPVVAFATAAVRDAANGADFVAAAQETAGITIEVISGEEEARLSGLGVLSAMPEANGIMGDLGGGSLELVELRAGGSHRQATLPLGPLRTSARVLETPTQLKPVIDQALDEVDWLPGHAGGELYAVGGAWRALARIHIEQTKHPLHMIHHYRLAADEALDLASSVSKMSDGERIKTGGVNKRRLETLPYAALLLHRLVKRSAVSSLVFSAYGLREGKLFEMLPAAIQGRDPLISMCRQFGQPMGHSVVDGDELWRWMRHVLSDENPSHDRLGLAACLLSDVARLEHPDYRAEHALTRVLRFPFVGVDHPGRAFVALAVASRHAKVVGLPVMKAIRGLLNRKAVDRARSIGLAIRLAYTLSGGNVEVLRRFRLERGGNELVLRVPPDCNDVSGDIVARRLGALADSLKLNPAIREASCVPQMGKT